MDAYPLLLTPIYKDYLWGGSRMARQYGRQDTPAVCAESWEVTDRPEGISVVTNGPLKGRSLSELVASMGAALLGKNVKTNAFPLLIKLIDAKQDLSVQVHPNDANAHLTGGEAKTEMWIVLDAEPGARIYVGLKPGITAKDFEQALADKTLKTVALASVSAAPGRAIYIPGGRVHAIGAGCLLLEVQQNSNTTYRVYDWDRVDSDGNSRELHLEQALKVIDWDNSTPEVMPPRPAESPGPNRWWNIIESPFFKTKRVDLQEPEEVSHTGDSFHVLFVTKGNALVGANGIVASVSAGTSCLIPAAATHYTLTPIAGTASVIQIESV
jgi:mannose-6-phosphate isomerase